MSDLRNVPAYVDDEGCYLGGHRGHYITRDMIELAVSFGYIIGPFEAHALATYDEWCHGAGDDGVDLFGALLELADDALDWLNCGENDGLDRPIKGQNSPPAIPEGFAWAWLDGDFGLYPISELED